MPVGYTTLTVVSGNTIPASWGNNVRDSVITQHATYGALSTAITSPQEGMLAYLTDTDTYWYYKNTNWRLNAGQLLYSKRDTSTAFLSNQAPGTFLTAFTSPAITVPTSGVGQAYEVEWTIPATNGAFAAGRFNSLLSVATNGSGTFTSVAKSGPVVTNANDVYLMQGKETWKAANGDTTVQFRLSIIAVGGNFDSIADNGGNPLLMRVKTTGLLSTEVV